MLVALIVFLVLVTPLLVLALLTLLSSRASIRPHPGLASEEIHDE